MTQVLALQVTLFPHYGLCIRFTIHHGAADGSTALQFMRSWSSLWKFTDELEKITVFAPFYDRSVIKDKDGLESIYLKDLRRFKWHLKTFKTSEITTNGVDMVRVTFILS
ncbi:hypothetical protein IFM89_030623 [Coptis chinensis]|uniref:Uncharacterized protein n=1 Tax=Coptis chinensis TaxID=261450 RepID=A0A835HKZ0_9MAGN|nr:hypothetical protein IFM89_030623 [Coptis chinensis]